MRVPQQLLSLLSFLLAFTFISSNETLIKLGELAHAPERNGKVLDPDVFCGFLPGVLAGTTERIMYFKV